MAFDQSTRNRLQKFVSNARAILGEEFTRQLQATYGLDPKQGTVAAIDSLTHLDNRQRQTAHLLRETLAHYLATTPGKGEKDRTKQVLDRIVREQAFTVLNRLAALRMAEARGFLLESIAKAHSSKGFQLYRQLSGTAHGETGDAYRNYLFSLFDEFSLDLAVLFDRHSAQGRLFPRETALLELLAEINHHEIEHLWAEDETIGWIYQYFNSQEERKKMRAESQAPRNSRELAVRNQFFTPRYVVEFLTDNTLGRIWYEMTQGNTALVDSCRYLVRRPTEIFLHDFQTASNLAFRQKRAEWGGSKELHKAINGDLSCLSELDPTIESVIFSRCLPLAICRKLLNDDDLFNSQIGNEILDSIVEQKNHEYKNSIPHVWAALCAYDDNDFSKGYGIDFRRAIWSHLVALTQNSDDVSLSQEELLKQPVYIPHRPLKDPRSIRMLDPACGSMHFGLYAFDLFERIYLEAWQLEQQLGPDAFTREAGQQALQSTFDSLETFKQQIPKLIIEHNIHGVDIDPRAVQIAGLSLWQRAQRAWHQQGIKPQQRPTIVKSNIVCAEPMPGEKALLQEFTSKLNPPVLGQLLDVIFDKMQLAGEAGTLLKIEEEIQTAIHEAREQWLKQSGSNSVRDMFQAEKDAATPQAKLGFDLSGVDDETFWDDAEQRILQALSDYADQAESNADQKRLFAEDAAKGFAFIDLCRKRFDVSLMNPPFGLPSEKSIGYLEKAYQNTYLEMYASFVSRCFHISSDSGLIGSISSRAFLTVNRLEEWRRQELVHNLRLILDLGQGVMDSAMVESAAYTINKPKLMQQLHAIDARSLKASERHEWDDLGVKDFYIDRKKIEAFPRNKIIYDAPDSIFDLFSNKFLFEPSIGTVRQGMGTFDDFRFVHLAWEVPTKEIGESKHWEPLTKGGAYSRYYADIYLMLNWRKNGGELSAVNISKNGQDAQVRQASEYWRRSGATYSKRSQKGFSARALPKGCILTGKGPAILSESDVDDLYLIGWVNSRLIRSLIEMQANFGEYNTGILKNLPWKKIAINCQSEKQQLMDLIQKKISLISLLDETNAHYKAPFFKETIGTTTKIINENIDSLNVMEKITASKWDDLVDNIYGVDSSIIDDNESPANSEQVESISPKDVAYLLTSYCVGVLFGRWEEKKDYTASLLEKRPNPFDSLPIRGCSSDINNNHLFFDYSDGAHGFSGKISRKLAQFFGDSIDNEISHILESKTLFGYLNNPSAFFASHLSMYSKSRRQAPIYWPLQTPSGSYTLWVYYHRLNEQTLYTCVNDFVEPKLEQVEQDLNGLRGKSARSSQEEKELEKLSDLASELRDFRDELLRLAKFWKPNLNDGVQITAAPLWKLFQHRVWQKKLKATWESLEKGDYDWAHLACSIWPERVLRKCHQDRSLAIAHDVEDHFWYEVEVPVKRGKKLTGETKLEWQPKDLSEAELNALVKKLAAEVKQ